MKNLKTNGFMEMSEIEMYNVEGGDSQNLDNYSDYAKCIHEGWEGLTESWNDLVNWVVGLFK